MICLSFGYWLVIAIISTIAFSIIGINNTLPSKIYFFCLFGWFVAGFFITCTSSFPNLGN